MTRRVGLVGCGHVSAAHLRGWRRAASSAVTGIFDLDRERAASRARQFAIPRVYDDLDAVFTDCDVVDICTPPQTHADLLRRALDAGVAVLIEKPVVTDRADWDELEPRFAAAGRPLAVVHNLKFSRSFARARAWLAQGRIGRLLRLDWHFMTSPEADRMLSGHHWSHALPGGRWFETLPHNLYGVHALCGPLDLASVAVRSTGSAPPGAPADEVTVVLAGGDVLAALHFSANCQVNRREVTLTGSEGLIRLDLLSDLAGWTRLGDTRARRALGRSLLEAAGRLASGVPDRAGYLADRLAGRTPHARLIQAFDRHLAGHGDSPTPLAEIGYVVRFSDLVGREIDRRLGDREGPA